MSASQPPGRERAIAMTFVEVADTLVDTFEVVDLLAFLSHRCAALLEGDLTGVVLEDSDGTLRLAATTSEAMSIVEELELLDGDGPCVHAYRSGERVRMPDLSDTPERWSTVIDELRHLGMRSGLALPLRLRDERIGALNLYTSRARDFTEDDVHVAQAFADVAVIGILQHRAIDAAERRAIQLQQALDSRVLIEQAKGVMVQRHGIDAAEAFERLRSHARSSRRRLADVAGDLLDGTLTDLPVT